MDATQVFDNRAVRLTAGGSSAIAVVRLIGPKIDNFLSRYFSRAVLIGRAVHGTLRDGDETIDDPILVRTSPTSIDINLHGSLWIVERVLRLARSTGFRIDEEAIAAHYPEAESVWPDVLAALPRARTKLAVRALLAQPKAWATATPDPDDRTLITLLSLPTVAIVGPANVGKSTLANTLFGQQRSIVADLPGTTRDWVGGVADIGGLAVTLIDTPGQRETFDVIEKAAQRASAAPVAAADLVVLVLDHSMPIGPTERAMISLHPRALVIANKSDRSPAWDATSEHAIETVAMTDAGVERLEHAILERFGCGDFAIDVARVF